jgi:hypothetical protein
MPPALVAKRTHTIPILIRDHTGRLHPYNLDPACLGYSLLLNLRMRLSLPPDVYLSFHGCPIRLNQPLHLLHLSPGATVDVLCRLRGGAPPGGDGPPPASPSQKRPRTQPRSDAISALRTFATGPFLTWRQRMPPADLARDIARLVSRWSVAGVDVQATSSLLADALGVPADAALELLWAWELICGWSYDPSTDTFSSSSPMDLDSSSASPLDEVTRLQRELDRVTQEAAFLRAQISPPSF